MQTNPQEYVQQMNRIIAEVKNGFAYQVFIVHSSSLLYNGHWNNCFPVQVKPTEAAHL